MTDETHEPEPDEQDVEPEGQPAGDELDDEQDGEPDGEPEPDEQDVEPDEQSSLAMVQALDREATRHEKALAKALGIPPESMHLCPTCEGMGYTPEPIEAAGDPPPDPFLTRCERCDGFGAVRTGARSSAMFEIPCPGCGSTGYVQLPEYPETQPSPPNGAPQVASVTPAAQVAPGDLDAIADLRRRGYTILDPIVVPEPVAP